MKNRNKWLLTGLSLSMLLLLSGCVSRDKSGNPTGTIWNLLGKPMSYVITYFGDHLGLGFGVGIIVTTIIVRLIILPLGLHQSWKAAYHTEKLNYLKPIFDPINERIKNASSQEERMAAQADLMAAQRQNGVSMLGGIGCLPIVAQWPFFSALYFAAQFTKGVSGSHFLWIDNLAKRDILLVVIIIALYFVQSYLSYLVAPEAQRKQMKTMIYYMPIMMGIFSFNLPASIGLYWFVGGIFSIIQQLIAQFIIRPKLHKRVEEEYKNNPPKPFKSSTPTRRDVTPKQAQAIPTPKTNRNAGKQRKRS